MKVLIMGLGGFGINLTAQAVQAIAESEELPNTDYLLIDGSDSNMANRDALRDNFWKVANTDGAGKKRAKGAAQYLDFVTENLAQVPDADMYVLVYSLSGGSGSVMGPEFNRQLMLAGKNCVNVVLSTDDSKEDVKNTFNTLTGLANNVKQLERPIHFVLEESSMGTRSEVDSVMLDHVISMASICGTPHHGLDSNDVKSWLDYQLHDVKPGLTLIERFDDAEALGKLSGSVITILSLLTDPDNMVPRVGAVFNTDGISEAEMDTHFITTTKHMDNLSRKITAQHEEYQKVAGGLNVKESFGSADCGDNGMVY
ncbi:hypothetical protein TSMG0102 [Halocynthia phage JM-2012]|uniref:tubulin PhuZ n=1 Tax=Halocynthia phage JM-2012 TaxID=1173297 RepID=UPI00025C693A|nr:tubulin PhuZ [Halocynthia phage JM-2012]AFI55385.1 hypothetical protein TSMG0102 [Halocynthia phage JM-2012]